MGFGCVELRPNGIKEEGIVMQFLALEQDIPGIQADDFQPVLKAEARRVWQLQQDGVLREMYFRGDTKNAVLMLECSDVDEAKAALSTLPLVEQGLIRFEVIPLIPYSGLARLFGPE